MRWNRTLKFARECGDINIVLEALPSLPVYSRARRKALNVAIDIAATPGDFRAIHGFTEEGSRQEHRAVFRWAQAAQTKEELTEVLGVVRGMTRVQGLERLVLRKLRPLGYREWWEVPIRERIAAILKPFKRMGVASQ